MLTIYAALGAVLAQEVTLDPDPGDFPGADALQNLVNQGAWVALVACVAAFIIGVIVSGLGSRAGSGVASFAGKTAAIVGVLGAVLIGAAAALVNWGYRIGQLFT